MKQGKGTWDRWGIFASIACAAHCLVAPIVFIFLPKVSGIWAHPASHALVALFVVPMAATVLRGSHRRTGHRWIGGAALIGIGSILVGSVLPYVEKSDPGPGKVAEAEESACASCCPQIVEGDGDEKRLKIPTASIVTVLGSLFLIGSHLGNLFACRCCGPQENPTNSTTRLQRGASAT